MSLRVNKRALFEDFGYAPHPLQLEVHESTAPRRVLACGVRWGKSLSTAMEAATGALTPSTRGPRVPTYGWIVGPNYDLASKVFREVVLVFHQYLRHRIVKYSEAENVLRVVNLGGGECEIKRKTADNPVSLMGEGLDWLVFDEAAQCKPDIWDRFLSARLVDKRGWALIISTPKGKGWFFDVWRRGQPLEPGGAARDPLWKSWNAPTWSNPHISRDEVNALRSRIPERVFRQEYGAEFIEGAGAVFRGVRELATREWAPYDPQRSYAAGLDLAKTVDYTVLVVMDDLKNVVHVERFHRLDWSIQGARILAALERYGNPPTLVDSTGKGEPVLEALLALGINAIGYTFTNASKAALINNLALCCERREIGLPRVELWPEGIDELESFEYSITDAGNVKTGAPNGQHDDCVIALSLAAWEVANRPIFVDEGFDEWA